MRNSPRSHLRARASKPSLWVALITGVALGVCTSQSNAANRTWKEGVDGFFDNADNWNPALVPNASDTLRFQLNSAGYTVKLMEDRSVQDIDFYTDITTIDLGSSILDTLTLRMARNANDDATMRLRSGVLQVSGGIQLAQSAGTKATLDIGAGATFDWIGASAAFNVGNVGEAAVRVHSGGKLLTKARAVTVGLSGSAGSAVRIEGAESAWSHTGSSFIIGAGSSGSFIIAEQGKLEINAASGNIVLGSGSASAEGKVHVTGSGSRVTTETLAGNFTHVGQVGRGELIIDEGASYEHTGGKIVLANGEASEGNITVSGDGSSFLARSSVDIGGAGIANFTVSEAAFARVEGDVEVGSLGVLSLLGGTMAIDNSLLMSAGSELNVRLDALAPDPIIQVGGNLNLGTEEVALAVTLGDSFAFNIGDRYEILGYTGSLDGIFQGLQEGEWLDIGVHTFQISYGGGINSTVSLTAIPEPSSIGFILISTVGGLLFRKRTTGRLL